MAAIQDMPPGSLAKDYYELVNWLNDRGWVVESMSKTNGMIGEGLEIRLLYSSMADMKQHEAQAKEEEEAWTVEELIESVDTIVRNETRDAIREGTDQYIVPADSIIGFLRHIVDQANKLDSIHEMLKQIYVHLSQPMQFISPEGTVTSSSDFKMAINPQTLTDLLAKYEIEKLDDKIKKLKPPKTEEEETP